MPYLMIAKGKVADTPAKWPPSTIHFLLHFDIKVIQWNGDGIPNSNVAFIVVPLIISKKFTADDPCHGMQ